MAHPTPIPGDPNLKRSAPGDSASAPPGLPNHLGFGAYNLRLSLPIGAGRPVLGHESSRTSTIVNARSIAEAKRRYGGGNSATENKVDNAASDEPQEKVEAGLTDPTVIDLAAARDALVSSRSYFERGPSWGSGGLSELARVSRPCREIRSGPAGAPVRPAREEEKADRPTQ